MTIDLEVQIDAELGAAKRAIDEVRRFDFDGDGLVGPDDWKFVRRMIATELRTRPPEKLGESTLATNPVELNDRYLAVGILGRGGQAVTYLACDEETGGRVAIKELHLGRIDDWKAMQLFEREAEALGRLDHPAIPNHVESFAREDDGDSRFFLVQQFVYGTDLASELETRGKFEIAEAMRVRDEVFSILEYIHGFEPPIVHRDIKPSNLIRRSDGSIVLVDFGAVQADAVKTAGGSTIVGTTGYMPVEQYMGRSVPASDIYALGATLVHLLSGKPPAELEVQNNRLQFEKVVRLPAPVSNGLGAMLQPAVERRPQTVADARRAFETAMVLPPKTEPTSSETAGRRRFLALAVVAFALAGGGTYWYYGSTGQLRGALVDVPKVSAEPAPDDMKVLFFGNSHTYWWHLPKVVAGVVPNSERRLWYDVVASPGVTLRWHLDNGAAEKISERDWDAIVLQPQSLEPATRTRAFGAALAEFEQLGQQANAEVIVWVPWARHPKHDIYDIYSAKWSGGSYASLQEKLSDGVRSWTNTSEPCPIGEAWLEAREKHPEAPLHQEKNGNSQTHVGAQLTAYMLYACIYERDPADTTGFRQGLSADAAAKLRKVASDVARKERLLESK